MEIYDISMTIKEGMIAYPGDPVYSRETFCDLEAGANATLTIYRFGSHTGTHVDAPSHMVSGGRSADEIPLETLVGAARVIHIPNERAITKAHLETKALSGVKRILVKTDNSCTLREQKTFNESFCYFDESAARYLASLGVLLVGFDYLSVDPYNEGHHRAHDQLLPNDIVILEGIDLKDVPEGDYLLVTGMTKIEHSDGAPARALLIKDPK